MTEREFDTAGAVGGRVRLKDRSGCRTADESYRPRTLDGERTIVLPDGTTRKVDALLLAALTTERGDLTVERLRELLDGLPGDLVVTPARRLPAGEPIGAADIRFGNALPAPPTRGERLAAARATETTGTTRPRPPGEEEAVVPQSGRGQEERGRHRMRIEQPLCIIDSEWNNGNLQTAEIVALAIRRMEPDGTWNQRTWCCRPGRPIQADAEAVHRISNEAADALPAFDTFAAEIAALLDGCDIAGYGVANDIQVLERELHAAGRCWQLEGVRIVDGLRLWQQRERRRLTDAYAQWVGGAPPHGRNHDAGHDVTVTAALIERMAEGAAVPDLHQEGHPGYVDPAGRFEKRGGVIHLRFGPHRGDPANAHPDFLNWMLDRDFAPSSLQVCRTILEELAADEPAAAVERDGKLVEDDPDGLPF